MFSTPNLVNKRNLEKPNRALLRSELGTSALKLPRTEDSLVETVKIEAGLCCCCRLRPDELHSDKNHDHLYALGVQQSKIMAAPGLLLSRDFVVCYPQELSSRRFLAVEKIAICTLLLETFGAAHQVLQRFRIVDMVNCRVPQPGSEGHQAETDEEAPRLPITVQLLQLSRARAQRDLPAPAPR